MKVTLLEIDKHVKDIEGDRDYVEIARLKHGGVSMDISDKDMPYAPAVDIIRERYHVETIHKPDGTLAKYLVKYDDRDIFNDLLLIGECTFSMAVTKRIGELVDMGELVTVSEANMHLSAQVEGIKRLPWYKRLFNKF